MSSAIIGRKVDKEVLFNIDGQPINDNVKVLKFAATPQPQLVKQSKEPAKKEQEKGKQKKVNNNSSQKTIPKKSTQIPNSKKQSESKKQQPTTQSHTVFQNITNHQKSAKLSSPESQRSPQHSPKSKSPIRSHNAPYREPRQFKPLSEQFPNLVGALFEQKKFTEDVDDDSQTSGTESYISDREQGDDEIRQAPQPESNPQVYRNVSKIVAENNKKYVYSKKEEAERQERMRQEKLQQRERMKKYGKQQIVRAHTQRENFEQKFAWGVNQKKLQEEKMKFSKLQEEKEYERQLKIEQQEEEQKPNQVNLAKLFPESQERESRYKKMWVEEAKKAVDKKQFSLSQREKTKSPVRCKSQHSSKLNQDFFEQNAKNIIDEMQQQKKQKQKETIIKKHKIDYINRQVKAIFSSMKKRKWTPNKEFDNKVGPSVSLSRIKQPREDFGVKEMFEEAENEAEDLHEQGTIQHYQQKVKNGKVLTSREVREFKEDQEKKQKKVEKFKTDLKDRKNITLKNPEPLTEKELKLKREMAQQIDIKGEVEKQIKKSQTKEPRNPQKVQKTTIQEPDLGEFIFAEAELPQYKGDYEEEQKMGFREQVEMEIKEQILMQKKKRPAVREVQQEKPRQEYARKPQEREKGPKYRKEQKFVSQPRYPVFHDLGEVQLLEDDMYNAQHSKWTPYAGKLIDNSSDEEDDKDFLEKTTIQLRSNLKKGKENVGSQKTYSKSVQGKKNVYFREPETEKKDIGNQYLTEQKEQLMRIVQNQKARGQMTSDDDSDTDFCKAYSSQIWLATDPMKRDVFIMTSKELMDLPHIQL
ncbi:unnamed protein product (macronuclear) [Paramecium tetraurelia]|uniref:Uncharacterized protein n=1 Tax=Paramecium tetraurelia TaxID=5888 RepID=A0DEX7_PARTE|nr:uncharacterized protein GSPATT00016420001 [Paramecium tetraurelia]CAK81594.1 unnamed protein product [Paramecium tetraurelia]|eukprot:XP_001448991.1 hypothetical protein (macronuclear) [Paramecium tetraurelia strain d4-2]